LASCFCAGFWPNRDIGAGYPVIMRAFFSCFAGGWVSVPGHVLAKTIRCYDTYLFMLLMLVSGVLFDCKIGQDCDLAMNFFWVC